MTTPAQARQTSIGRVYEQEGRDVQFLSVTTALQALPKDALMYWAAREVAGVAVEIIEGRAPLPVGADGEPLAGDDLHKWLKTEPLRQRDSAGNIGDLVHGYAEDFMRAGLTVEEMHEKLEAIEDKKVRARVKQFVQWVEDFRVEPIAVEVTIYNDEHGYAGSCDLIAHVPGYGVVLVDLKTSKGIYGSVALQAIAYARGEYILTDEGERLKLPEINMSAVLHIKARSYVFRKLDASDECFEHFVHLLHTKREILPALDGRLLHRIEPGVRAFGG